MMETNSATFIKYILMFYLFELITICWERVFCWTISSHRQFLTRFLVKLKVLYLLLDFVICWWTSMTLVHDTGYALKSYAINQRTVVMWQLFYYNTFRTSFWYCRKHLFLHRHSTHLYIVLMCEMWCVCVSL